jgi:hypothetical protein
VSDVEGRGGALLAGVAPAPIVKEGVLGLGRVGEAGVTDLELDAMLAVEGIRLAGGGLYSGDVSGLCFDMAAWSCAMASALSSRAEGGLGGCCEGAMDRRRGVGIPGGGPIDARGFMMARAVSIGQALACLRASVSSRSSGDGRTRDVDELTGNVAWISDGRELAQRPG